MHKLVAMQRKELDTFKGRMFGSRVCVCARARERESENDSVSERFRPSCVLFVCVCLSLLGIQGLFDTCFLFSVVAPGTRSYRRLCVRITPRNVQRLCASNN